MGICQASYAIGSISAARASLTSAQRALDRRCIEGPNESNVRAMAALEQALSLIETAIHELGSDMLAKELTARAT